MNVLNPKRSPLPWILFALVIGGLLAGIIIVWQDSSTPIPTVEPTEEVTPITTPEPTSEPTSEPTVEPTAEPEPTTEPEPTVDPVPEPTDEPTAKPTEEPTPVTPIKPQILYTVVSGDSLWSISLINYGTGTLFECIAEANNIDPQECIHVDQVLIIPECGASDGTN